MPLWTYQVIQMIPFIPLTAFWIVFYIILYLDPLLLSTGGALIMLVVVSVAMKRKGPSSPERTKEARTE